MNIGHTFTLILVSAASYWGFNHGQMFEVTGLIGVMYFLLSFFGLPIAKISNYGTLLVIPSAILSTGTAVVLSMFVYFILFLVK